MANEYHVLHAIPAIHEEDWDSNSETLTKRLVASGLLRINADSARNYIHYTGADFDKTFSKREMLDDALSFRTRDVITRTLPGSAGDDGVHEVYERLLYQFRKTGEIPLAQELKIARIMVQATEAVIIEMILHERVEIFVSYSHDVSELMAVHAWEQGEGSGGLQATSGDGAAVYVSCGGDPFFAGKHKTFVTDGFPALARFMVIAAQELGHYADLLRNERGEIIARHSAEFYPSLIAKEHVREARIDDGYHVQALFRLLHQCGVYKLAKYEKALRFFKEKRKNSLVYWFYRAKCVWLSHHVMQAAKQHDTAFVLSFPKHIHGGDGWATNMTRCAADMLFNLAPKADAYLRDDKQEEEAIACIEALARVPQQAVKWSHDITQTCWPSLYAMYYEDVISENKRAFEQISGLSHVVAKSSISHGKRTRKWIKLIGKE